MSVEISAVRETEHPTSPGFPSLETEFWFRLEHILTLGDLINIITSAYCYTGCLKFVSNNNSIKSQTKSDVSEMMLMYTTPDQWS